MSEFEPPSRSKGDIVHMGVKAIASAVPVVGGPAAELFQFVIQPPLEKRRDEWMRAVGKALEELSEQDRVKLDGLSQNEQFVTAVMEASQVALRTHQQDKLAALRNAVLNVALGSAPDDTKQHMFFRLVDDFTPLHIQLLRLFQIPVPPQKTDVGEFAKANEYCIAQLRAQDALYTQVGRELVTNGLLNPSDLGMIVTELNLSLYYKKRTSPFGDEFLSFISDPPSAV